VLLGKGAEFTDLLCRLESIWGAGRDRETHEVRAVIHLGSVICNFGPDMAPLASKKINQKRTRGHRLHAKNHRVTALIQGWN